MNIWITQSGSDLAQGDLLPECAVPMVAADFEPTLGGLTIVAEVRDLIVITQSCDLAQLQGTVRRALSHSPPG